MDIQMVGLDYTEAGLDVREVFSYTRRGQAEALQKLKKTEGIAGCVLLSTCNRTELWISHEEGWGQDVRQIFCGLKGVEPGDYEEILHIFAGQEAVSALFYLASGLKSRILGEDQILTQVREACELARQNYCTDKVLETLFRMAVTAAKEVKTQIAFPMGNHSAPLAAVTRLEQQGAVFAGSRCLVIGNGAMGRLTAQLLIDRGADVTVTIRQYKSGIVDVPFEAQRIDYSRRYEIIPECDYVFGVTASPNITVKCGDLQGVSMKRDITFVDLAVPRDIDKSVGDMQGVQLYDIDDFEVEMSGEMKELLRQAGRLLEQGIGKFVCWYEARDAVPVLMRLGERAAADVIARVDKPIQKAAPGQREQIEESVQAAVKKVVNRLMFCVRDSVDIGTFRECVDAMQKLYETEEDSLS